VLSDWVGYWVFISYISGPNLDIEEPKAVRDQPQAVTTLSSGGLRAVGIEVKRNPTDPTIFMSQGLGPARSGAAGCEEADRPGGSEAAKATESNWSVR